MRYRGVLLPDHRTDRERTSGQEQRDDPRQGPPFPTRCALFVCHTGVDRLQGGFPQTLLLIFALSVELFAGVLNNGCALTRQRGNEILHGPVDLRGRPLSGCVDIRDRPIVGVGDIRDRPLAGIGEIRDRSFAGVGDIRDRPLAGVGDILASARLQGS